MTIFVINVLFYISYTSEYIILNTLLLLKCMIQNMIIYILFIYIYIIYVYRTIYINDDYLYIYIYIV